MITESETVTIGWCDNGTTDGKFTEGLMRTVIAGPANGIKIHNSVRVQGNQIARQRQRLFDHWADDLKTDWLLWVDSDISLTTEALCAMWQVADGVRSPVVTGVYFISKEIEGSLGNPYPAIFMDVSEYEIGFIHPLPKNEIIQCDSAGMGFVIMHKSIVLPLRSAYPNQGLFQETHLSATEFIGEDISFFRKLKSVGVPLYAYTGALVKHVKRFNLDIDYYDLYWEAKNSQSSEFVSNN